MQEMALGWIQTQAPAVRPQLMSYAHLTNEPPSHSIRGLSVEGIINVAIVCFRRGVCECHDILHDGQL